MPKTAIMHRDENYDADTIRRKIRENGALPNFPPKGDRRWKNCFSPFLHRDRGAMKRVLERPRSFAVS